MVTHTSRELKRKQKKTSGGGSSQLYVAGLVLLFLMLAVLIFMSIRGGSEAGAPGTPEQAAQLQGRAPTENLILKSLQPQSDLAIDAQ